MMDKLVAFQKYELASQIHLYAHLIHQLTLLQIQYTNLLNNFVLAEKRLLFQLWLMKYRQTMWILLNTRFRVPGSRCKFQQKLFLELSEPEECVVLQSQLTIRLQECNRGATTYVL